MNNYDIINHNDHNYYDYSLEFQIKNINYLNTYFYYLNENNEVDKIIQHKCKLNNNDNIIEKSQLFDLIKMNKFKNSHKLFSILVYNIYVQPNQLYDYIINEKDYINFYNLKKIEQFQMKKTMKFLNCINGIYLFFKKTKIHNNNFHSNTKKVTIKSNNNKHKKTQKFSIYNDL